MSYKFLSAIKILKPNTPMCFYGDVKTEKDFKKVNWETSIDKDGFSITTNTCPHSEITWTKVKAEMDKL